MTRRIGLAKIDGLARDELGLAKGLNLALKKGYTKMCFCQKGKKANWWKKPITAAEAIGCMSHKPHTWIRLIARSVPSS